MAFDAEAILADYFAPWIQDLGLEVQASQPGLAVLRLPWSARLSREGGGLCGQAMMAAADTASVIAIGASRGGFVPMTTVQQSTSFQRPVIEADLIVAAPVTKLGRTLAYVDIVMSVDGTDTVCAHATTVYAVMG